MQFFVEKPFKKWLYGNTPKFTLQLEEFSALVNRGILGTVRLENGMELPSFDGKLIDINNFEENFPKSEFTSNVERHFVELLKREI